MKKVIYKESQRITQKWIWLLMSFLTLTFFVILYIEIHYTDSVEELSGYNSPSVIGMFLIIGLLILLWLLLLRFRLITEVTENSFRYRLVPLMFKFREVKAVDIERVEVVEYQPMREYLGWGYRFSIKRKNSRAFTVSGNKGISVDIKNGKHLLIGTNNPVATSVAILRMMQTD